MLRSFFDYTQQPITSCQQVTEIVPLAVMCITYEYIILYAPTCAKLCKTTTKSKVMQITKF